MHDLRYDPADPTDAHAPDLRERKALDPASLRTVPMPNLRSPGARTLDARMDAIEQALERIADAVTILMLERELAQGQAAQPRRINGYE